MINLYKKVASIDINGKKFKSPPFSISFELEQGLSAITKTTVTLYNPNDDTISKCEANGQGKDRVFPNVKVTAGYEDNEGLTSEGLIKNFNVFRQGTNRILEMQVFDNEKWRDEKLNKGFKDIKISAIIDEITQGRESSVRLGEDKLLKKFYVRDRYTAIKNLVKMSKSQFSLQNGKVVIKPKGFIPAKAFLLDYGNGLVEIPEKIDRPKSDDQDAFSGYKIKTLFIFGLEIWSSVKVKTTGTIVNGKSLSGVDFSGVVVKAIKRFSSFENAFCEYEIRT